MCFQIVYNNDLGCYNMSEMIKYKNCYIMTEYHRLPSFYTSQIISDRNIPSDVKWSYLCSEWWMDRMTPELRWSCLRVTSTVNSFLPLSFWTICSETSTGATTSLEDPRMKTEISDNIQMAKMVNSCIHMALSSQTLYNLSLICPHTHTHTHTVTHRWQRDMMHRAALLIGSSLWFSFMPKDTLTSGQEHPTPWLVNHLHYVLILTAINVIIISII